MILTGQELIDLIQTVFSPRPEDKNLAILIDLPDAVKADHAFWSNRRSMAFDWRQELNGRKLDLGPDEINLIANPNVHSNNADLPQTTCIVNHRLDSDHLALIKDYYQGQDFSHILEADGFTIRINPCPLSSSMSLISGYKIP